MKRTLALALTATLAVILSGCMRMHVNLTLEEGDKASGTMIFAISDEVAKQFEMDPEELFNSMLSEQGGEGAMAPEGSTEAPYAQDGYTGKQWTFESKSLADAGGGQDLKIVRDSDDYVVSGNLDMSDAGADDQMTAGLADSMDIEVSITFPGEVKEHNGDLDGKTVTWSPDAGENLQIEARGGASASSGSSVLTAVLVILGVLVIAGILFAIFGRKKNKGADGPEYTYAANGQPSGAPATGYPTAGSHAAPDAYAPGQTAAGGFGASGLGSGAGLNEPGSGAIPGTIAGAAAAAGASSAAANESTFGAAVPNSAEIDGASNGLHSSNDAIQDAPSEVAEQGQDLFGNTLAEAQDNAQQAADQYSEPHGRETTNAAPLQPEHLEANQQNVKPIADSAGQVDYTQEQVEEPSEDTIQPSQTFPQPPVDPQNPENPQQ